MTSVSVLMPNEYHCEVIKVTPNAPMLKVSAYKENTIIWTKSKTFNRILCSDTADLPTWLT